MPGNEDPQADSRAVVVAAPPDIDITTAEQLGAALLDAAGHGPTVVVDLTTTRFCDSAGLHVLVRAHRRALAEGGELRLVIPAEGAVARLLAVTGLHHLIPTFGRLDQALTPGPAAVILPRPCPSAGGAPSCPPAPQAGQTRKPAARGIFEASVTARDSGPFMTLAGEADLTTAEQLSALITRQLDGQAHQLTIDVSGLRFADVAAIRTLVLAASTLKRYGARLVLLHPQPPVAKIVTLLGADQVITLRGTGTTAA